VAGQNLYLLNAPAFAKARIDFGGQELMIDTTGFAEPEPGGPAQYVRSATLNGEPLNDSWLTARELHQGGTLQLELGPEPSDWGQRSRPPSVSQPNPEQETIAMRSVEQTG
jgi:putative alpha-1,2-mannosidase